MVQSCHLAPVTHPAVQELLAQHNSFSISTGLLLSSTQHMEITSAFWCGWLYKWFFRFKYFLVLCNVLHQVDFYTIGGRRVWVVLPVLPQVVTRVLLWCTENRLSTCKQIRNRSKVYNKTANMLCHNSWTETHLRWLYNYICCRLHNIQGLHLLSLLLHSFTWKRRIKMTFLPQCVFT